MTATYRVTGTHSRRLIGRACQWLRQRGWSAGESKLHDSEGSLCWKVEASDAGGQSVIASASSQSGAWDLACRMVGRLPSDD